jgi:hypothetical protein
MKRRFSIRISNKPQYGLDIETLLTDYGMANLLLRCKDELFC